MICSWLVPFGRLGLFSPPMWRDHRLSAEEFLCSLLQILGHRLSGPPPPFTRCVLPRLSRFPLFVFQTKRFCSFPHGSFSSMLERQALPRRISAPSRPGRLFDFTLRLRLPPSLSLTVTTLACFTEDRTLFRLCLKPTSTFFPLFRMVTSAVPSLLPLFFPPLTLLVLMGAAAIPGVLCAWALL